MRIYDINTRVYFVKKKYFTSYRVTLQETTFTRTISRNQILQTKTPEKEHVNMGSQTEWEGCVAVPF